MNWLLEQSLRVARVLSRNSAPIASKLFLRMVWISKGTRNIVQYDAAEQMWYAHDSDSSRFYAPTYWRARRYYRRNPEACRTLLVDKYGLSTRLAAHAVLIDVGANNGELTVAALQAGCRVIAIEPDEAARRALVLNVARFGDHVTVLPCVVADQSGPVSFHLAPDSGDSSVIKPDQKAYLERRVITLEARTVDQIVKDYAEGQEGMILLKIEAEGFEPEIIDGSTELLKRKEVYVTVDAGPERHGATTSSAVINRLSQLGYTTTLRANVVLAER